jgi:hypothetical protein
LSHSEIVAVADYYSILFKAVSALEQNTASARQRLYERARSAMSAEIAGACPPFDASDIAAAKQGLRSAIDRIEAEALPGWLQQPQRAACANDCPATAELLPDEGTCRFLDASEIAAARQGLERAIERIEAEANPAWSQQPERVVRASDCSATANVPAEIGAACSQFDVSQIAAAKQGLECAMMSIEAEAVPDRPRQAEATAGANDCPATADLPAEIEVACPDGSEIAAAMQRLESAIEKIKAEAIPALPQQPERVVCANDCSATADAPAEIEETCPPFDASEIADANQGLENAIERIEPDAIPDWLQQLERAVCANDCPATADLTPEIVGAFLPFHAPEIVAAEHGLESAIERTEAIPDWLRQPERAVRVDDCPGTAANQNKDSPGPIKKLWTRLTGWGPGRQSAPLGRDTWLTDLLERASDEADNDEQNFAPTRAHTQ